jgi:uncharacterized damage-inducible protein DinB
MRNIAVAALCLVGFLCGAVGALGSDRAGSPEANGQSADQGTPSGRASQTAAYQAPAYQAAQSEDKTQPSYDMKGQALVDIDQLHQKYVALAQAIPPEKFSWRPADGVRSIGEVFLHISAANYNIPTLMGAAPQPAYMKPDFEKSITEKAKIVDELNKSFDYSRGVVDQMSNADFAKLQPKLGPQANSGDVVYILVTHAHEHLGQSIAYARQNGVVPPWTVAAQAAAAKAKDQKPQQKPED